MPTFRHLLQAILILMVVGAAARTAWVSYHHGTGSGKTASWQLYCLGRRWPWLVWVHGAACGAAWNEPMYLVVMAVTFAAGHWWGAMSDHPDATGAAR